MMNCFASIMRNLDGINMKQFKMWVEDNFEQLIMAGVGICGLTAGYILGHDTGYTKALRDVKAYLQKEEFKNQ